MARVWTVLASLACLAGLALAGPVPRAHAAAVPPIGVHHHKHPGVVRVAAAVTPESVDHAGVDGVAASVVTSSAAAPVTVIAAAHRGIDGHEPLTARGRGPPSFPV